MLPRIRRLMSTFILELEETKRLSCLSRRESDVLPLPVTFLCLEQPRAGSFFGRYASLSLVY